ncbi:hypothetical protein COU95_01625 [Candidatus Shapirobacteria bacterium CG10_big_fil_rev_8_21_14_0_10_40_9]|uniref:Uncharacterized protein n=1 Tax=Candidatus Shapirobacteria bacterium CG10_big_fil_rev_8_21_14_0_10_40_9 TaxID=1974888 RepID=A0A2M8L3S0_9BACT|nr:MAG: hypothetical protein COU95_01625 [Candidatus Shapirobacteria bacterium CG10_big_fil_rev_8_21_14_0_10_40_9]
MTISPRKAIILIIAVIICFGIYFFGYQRGRQQRIDEACKKTLAEPTDVLSHPDWTKNDLENLIFAQKECLKKLLK